MDPIIALGLRIRSRGRLRGASGTPPPDRPGAPDAARILAGTASQGHRRIVASNRAARNSLYSSDTSDSSAHPMLDQRVECAGLAAEPADMPIVLQRSIGFLCSVLLLPALAIMSIAVRLDSPGPALFRARRIGYGGAPFDCLKLRTMRTDADSGPAVTVSNDRRVTRVGSLLRRFRLDELPQLWNVARGEMLLVGPRPEDPRFVDLSDPLHREVFMAMPGITGAAQLAYVNEAELLDSDDPDRHYRKEILPHKLELDAAYLRRRSPNLDAWILVQTILAAVGRPPSRDAIEARL
jgi:lipopolysaccharide/colanic/teichoic acid biosynthesis glycosyltransferase